LHPPRHSFPTRRSSDLDQRPLLTNEPSFSIQCVAGRRKTSVLMLDASMFGACQNSELVVGSASMTTSHLRFERPLRTWFESGPIDRKSTRLNSSHLGIS